MKGKKDVDNRQSEDGYKSVYFGALRENEAEFMMMMMMMNIVVSCH